MWGSVKRWKELKAAHRAERPSKVRKDTMKWSEKRASNRDERGLGNWLGRSKALPEAMWILAPLISGHIRTRGRKAPSSLRTFLRFIAWYLH